MTREEMESQIINDIDNWDLDTLIGYAKADYRKQFKQMGDTELTEWWDFQCNPHSD